YHLWQGTDFDIDRAMQVARESVTDSDIRSALQEVVVNRPLVARRHSIETGAVRVFASRYLTVKEALTLDPALLWEQIGDGKVDGLLVYLLPHNLNETAGARGWAQLVTDERVIVVAPATPTQI